VGRNGLREIDLSADSAETLQGNFAEFIPSHRRTRQARHHEIIVVPTMSLLQLPGSTWNRREVPVNAATVPSGPFASP
jgi:hypothetical protein